MHYRYQQMNKESWGTILTYGTQHCSHDCRMGRKRQCQACPSASQEVAQQLTFSSPCFKFFLPSNKKNSDLSLLNIYVQNSDLSLLNNIYVQFLHVTQLYIVQEIFFGQLKRLCKIYRSYQIIHKNTRYVAKKK